MRTRTLEVPQVANLFFKFGALLFVLIICANGSAAQTYRGKIHGVVTDPSGAVVVAASVTAKNIANGNSRTVANAGDGGYQIPELEAGEYSIEDKATGLRGIPRKAIVEVGRDTTLDIALTIGNVDYVEVPATAPLVDTERDVLGEVVDNRMVEELPLNGRDFGN